MKEYDKSNIILAKALRKNMTPEEKHLWYDFLRDYPVRFQRQKAIGHYIADFYCAKAHLVVEIDGNGHATQEQKEYDEIRTAYFESIGIKVIRFTNYEIKNKFRGVCIYIDTFVCSSLPPSTSRLTPPSSDGG
ncbi:MAG: endonuclease domain-containing protein [Clostridia bacterium]|nr:endonuclease domain-containing protein [Clostridia bacterium]